MDLQAPPAKQTRSVQLGNIRLDCDQETLKLTGNHVTAEWEVRESGIRLRTLAGPQTGSILFESPIPSFELPELVMEDDHPELLGCTLQKVQDHSYLPDHLEASVVLQYRDFDIRYRIWAFADAPGYRTQLGLRFHHRYEKEELSSWIGGSLSERIPLDPVGCAGLAAGYYNDTQHRNYDHTPILRRQRWAEFPRELTSIDWANLVSVWQKGNALTLVKESHKTVNQSGIDTGAFIFQPGQIGVTGLGLCDHTYAGGAAWHAFEGWRDAWATWVVLSDAKEQAVQQAVKQMDRARYPFRPERDEVMMSNTWGSGGAGEGSRKDACEETVFREMESAADLGLDLVQIDDGWQCGPDAEHPTRAEGPWLPHPARWPRGWQPLVTRAKELGIDLGLWFNWSVDVEKMLVNGHRAGVKRFKLDFLHARTRETLEAALEKANRLSGELGPRVGINWDGTEEMARMGYFVGRDVGNIYLSNRSTGFPRLTHTEYKPHLQLREAWHLAHFLNLNQFQLTVQNVDLLPETSKDSGVYPMDYCFGIAMAGLPILFMHTHKLSGEAREDLRPLIQRYRAYRHEIHHGLVHPVGSEPDCAQWTGFQICDPTDGSGHLLLFREPDVEEESGCIDLVEAAADSSLELLHSTAEVTASLSDTRTSIRLKSPAGKPLFAWYRYGTPTSNKTRFTSV